MRRCMDRSPVADTPDDRAPDHGPGHGLILSAIVPSLGGTLVRLGLDALEGVGGSQPHDGVAAPVALEQLAEPAFMRRYERDHLDVQPSEFGCPPASISANATTPPGYCARSREFNGRAPLGFCAIRDFGGVVGSISLALFVSAIPGHRRAAGPGEVLEVSDCSRPLIGLVRLGRTSDLPCHMPVEAAKPLEGERRGGDEHASAVARVGLPSHEATPFQAIEESGHAAAREAEPRAHLAGGERPVLQGVKAAQVVARKPQPGGRCVVEVVPGGVQRPGGGD